TVILALLPASLFEPNLNIEEVYTVDLFDVMEAKPVQQSAPPPPPVVKQEVIKQSPPQTKPLISEAPAPEITSGPVEVISLSPRLVKKDLRAKNKAAARQEQKKLSRALEKIQSRIKADQERIKADQEAQKAQDSANAAVKDALAQLRASIHTSQTRTAAVSKVGSASGGSAGSRGRASAMDAVLKQYYVAVSRQIHKFWILPDLQDWEKQLTAVYVVHVRRDGIVTKSYMEKKSADLYFNQFVEKTIQEALPLPPFPDGLKEKQLEIGLVFHPSGLE
ncbi:MAG: TonB C-terminal domain-containing protein, partial [Thermodesulfobacteriota bacterium]|nr:TonB C-terminal domain-containing protein [Thermodesulfobacteriota bacterium]